MGRLKHYSLARKLFQLHISSRPANSKGRNTVRHCGTWPRSAGNSCGRKVSGVGRCGREATGKVIKNFPLNARDARALFFTVVVVVKAQVCGNIFPVRVV